MVVKSIRSKNKKRLKQDTDRIRRSGGGISAVNRGIYTVSHTAYQIKQGREDNISRSQINHTNQRYHKHTHTQESESAIGSSQTNNTDSFSILLSSRFITTNLDNSSSIYRIGIDRLLSNVSLDSNLE